ncbi:hypothetical protein PV10_05113 [Exophiala mesophila]|uniref:Transglutaminase-like domain-containing protein n=1 Tax=Exophiala mesophila TaxID=212818 RepID=A0A0D1Y0C3_EXOME|nr:uncharacterized protein PV10_05113 [Exophiala mesophila]KIV93941.1 hypothetical protein PV10_05113 [Exophiala mesophila]
MAEDPQPLTLQQRIAALNAAHIGRVPGEPPRPSSHSTPPIVPTRRPIIVKQHSINNPPERSNASVSVANSTIGNQPAPPPVVRKPPPPLPNRKTSREEERRGSVASTVSTGGSSVVDTPASSRVTTTRTKSTDSASRVKAPAWGECQLPALPPKNAHPATVTRKYSEEKPKYVNRAPSATSITPATTPPTTGTDTRPAPPPRPSLPPRFPSRKAETEHREHATEQPAVRKLPPMPSAESIERAKKAAFAREPSQEQVHHTQHDSPTSVKPEPTSTIVRDQPSWPSRDKVSLPSREAVSAHVHSARDLFNKHVSPVYREKTNGYISRPEPEVTPNHIPQTQPLRESLPTYNSHQEQVQDIASTQLAQHHQGPPPIPVSSRPDLSAIQATKPKLNGTTASHHHHSSSSANVCLVCRDFSAPDHQATLFPRQQVTSLQTLAHQLTAPFSSDTDKARAIFSWLHHNIAYDVVSFFKKNVKPSTPQSTFQSGLAVCEGYAALFCNLATYAGLESVVIGGHGKGYGYTALAPGSPLPPYNAGHAWNAVRIDDGEWKLIDACWGAGHVQGAGRPYVKHFTPEYFSMTNEEFAIKHFPENKDYFFLPGGRRLTWQEYIVIDPARWPDMVEPPTVFTNAKEDYSIREKSVLPRARQINVGQSGMVHFQFSLLCPHWTLEYQTRKGPPPVFIVSVQGANGQSKDQIPMDHHAGPAGQGGDIWTVDIPAHQLGPRGQTVTLFAVTSFGDRQDARGLTVREFREGKGRVGMGFVGIAAWELV